MASPTTPRPPTNPHSKKSRWPGSMSIAIDKLGGLRELEGGLRPPSDSRRAPGGALLVAFPQPKRQDCAGKAGARAVASLLPGDDLIRGEDALEQGFVGKIVGNALEFDSGREGNRRGARQADDGHLVTGGVLAGDHVQHQLGIVPLQQVQDARHEKTRKRRPCRMSSATSACETLTIGCPASFQSGSAGTAPASTWKGMPSRLRFSRKRAMSSPSTRSSVSASSRWTAGPRNTNVTVFSPATTPTPMRMASKARCEVRGSHAITTRTGWSSSAIRTGGSVQRDETIRAVDQVGQHHQAAVGDPVGVAQGQAALLTAVRAHEELGAAIGQRADARIVERAHAIVDQVEVQLRAAGQGRVRESDRRLEVAVV